MYIEEYLEKNKKEKLTEDNFNEVDAMMFALLTLFDVNFVPEKEEEAITLEEFIKLHIQKYKVKKLGFLIPFDMTTFLIKVSKSKRYKDVKVFGRYLNISVEEETQTTIYQAKISDNLTVVIFGGTDDTIIGWKEDLNISYINTVPCIVHSEEYMNRLPNDRNYIFTGHSKGGMESLYAGLKATRLSERIHHIYGFDPPGFNYEVNEELKESPLVDRTTLLCPNACVVGRLFYHPVKHEVTHSKDRGVMQHNPMGWVIEETSFKRIKEFTKGSEAQSNDVNAASRNITPERLKTFIDTCYKVLSAGGSFTLTDMKKHIHDINRTLFKLPHEDKKNFIQCFGYIVNKKMLPRRLLEEAGFLREKPKQIKKIKNPDD